MFNRILLLSSLAAIAASSSPAHTSVPSHLSCIALSSAGTLPSTDGVYYAKGNEWAPLSIPSPYVSCRWCLVGGSFGNGTSDILLAKQHSQTRLASQLPELLIMGLDGPQMEVLLVHLNVEDKYRQAIVSGDAAKKNSIVPMLTQLKEHVRCAVPPAALDTGEYIVAVHDRELDFDRRAAAYEFGIDPAKSGR
jgi:hypothetical protein